MAYIEDPDLEWVMIDSTTVKAHPCATGDYKNGSQEQGIGRSRGGLTSKIHLMMDALGNALRFIVGPGNESDIKVAKPLIQDIRDAAIMGDKGYDSDELRHTIQHQNCESVIPGRSNRIVPIEYDKELYTDLYKATLCAMAGSSNPEYARLCINNIMNVCIGSEKKRINQIKKSI